jgi:flagellin
VDAKSLGLAGVQAIGVSGTDIGSGSATTSVQQIVNDSTNVASLAVAGYTDFYFRGPGFSDNDAVKVSVSINGVADTDTLVANINAAIEAAGNGGTQAAAAFKAANIRASIVTDSDGKQRLAFSSSDAAFQVAAGDKMANALMGNFAAGATGYALDHTVTSGTNAAADATIFNAASDQKVIVRFSGASLASPVDIELNITAGSTTVGQVITDLGNQIASNTALQAAGITLATHADGTPLSFTSKRGEIFEVQVSGDTANRLGLGTWRALDPVTGGFDYTSITGSGATFAAATTQTLEFSIAGGTKQSVTINAGEATTVAQAVAYLNNAFMSNSVLRAAGLVASNSGGQIKIDSTNGTYFRINGLAAGAVNELGFGASGVASAAGYSSTITTKHTFNAGGSSVTALGTNGDVFSFQAIRNGGDDQTVTISATDADGTQHSLAVVLRNDSSVRNATSLDDALDAINSALQQSNDSTLKRIVAVKEINAAGTAEGIRFLSDLPSFKVSIGTNTGGVGLRDDASGGPVQGVVVDSEVSSGGSNVAVDTQAGAEAAVTALAKAVEILGQAQAVVGKGQNQFNFAISLAQTQLNNLAASESRIRDADLAAEAANLTKAQILQQAGIAALAQANVAPQAVLSLLRG